MTESPILEISNLSFCYENEEVLKGVDLKIYKNDFVAILGPNGGGKSTLVKIICGLLSPKDGFVNFKGKDISKHKLPVGYVPQSISFDKNFPTTVLDIVLMGRVKNIKFFRYSKTDKKIALDALKLVGMTDFKSRFLSELSGGQMQRVLIARALATESEILILDEPTSSVDPHNSESIYKLIDDLSQTKTVILVTHDLSVVSNYTNKIVFINGDAKIFDDKEIPKNFFSESYGCPVDLIAHGAPHRVINMYGEGGHNHD